MFVVAMICHDSLEKSFQILVDEKNTRNAVVRAIAEAINKYDYPDEIPDYLVTLKNKAENTLSYNFQDEYPTTIESEGYDFSFLTLEI